MLPYPATSGASDPVLIILEIFCVLLFGLALGSFTTAISYRIPQGIPWAFGRRKEGDATISAYRSVCTHCKTALALRDLIPVISWLLARGRCRYCRESIGASYLWIELTVVALCLTVYGVHGLSAAGIVMMLAVPLLVALLVIDLQHLILPNQLILILAVLGLAYHAAMLWPAPPTDLSAILWYLTEYVGGALVYSLLLWALGMLTSFLLKKPALGLGDVKFFAMAGVWLGLSLAPVYFLLCGFYGIGFGLLWRLAGRGAVFPFGPALIAAFFTLLLVGGSFFQEIGLQ